MSRFVEVIMSFLFSAPKGSVRRKHQRATLLGIVLGVLAAAGFGLVLFLLNRSQRF